MKHVLTVYCHLTANKRGHTKAMGAQVRALRTDLAWVWVAAGRPKPPAGAPVWIRLTRWAMRPLDEHDNLRTALKPVVDELVHCLGLPDDSPRQAGRLALEYAQETGHRTSRITVELEWPDVEAA